MSAILGAMTEPPRMITVVPKAVEIWDCFDEGRVVFEITHATDPIDVSVGGVVRSLPGERHVILHVGTPEVDHLGRTEDGSPLYALLWSAVETLTYDEHDSERWNTPIRVLRGLPAPDLAALARRLSDPGDET